MSDNLTHQSSLKALIAKGKEQNYLTYAEVNDHLPETISDPDQVEDIIQMIDDMGIKVYETAPDADQLALIENNDATDELAAAEAAAALAAVENEAGRTTDPVRMYMREMGTVELLTRTGEIAIAKRIEEGLRETYSEDELTDVGNIYVLYKALEDGHFSDELDTGLNADQKQYLLSMSVYKTLEFKVIRRDCLVNIVTIPLHLGSSENHNKFKFTITLEASLDADEILGVGGEYSGISKDGFLKFASAYQA